ncbi:MAG: NAD-dependent epimerase/dehydratase family protein [Pseudobdellovibrionaceae bacterium]
MKYLFIGGTKFVGRQMVEDALKAGHEVHILQRGQTGSDLFPHLKKYFGDRNQITDILPQDARFDVVIDTCGYHPESVRRSAELLKDRTSLYVFISTGSVYADFSKTGLNEASQVSKLNEIPDLSAKITPENYGPLKFLCEQQVIKTFRSDKSLILRPTIIVGPHDATQRFDYWIKAIMNGRKIKVPDDSMARIQFIDVRALSQFAIEAAENNIHGVYNVIGPKNEVTLLEFLKTAKSVLDSNIEFEYCSSEIEQNFPMYTNHPDWHGFFQIDGKKAYEAGLLNISIEETIQYVAQSLQHFRSCGYEN